MLLGRRCGGKGEKGSLEGRKDCLTVPLAPGAG